MSVCRLNVLGVASRHRHFSRKTSKPEVSSLYYIFTGDRIPIRCRSLKGVTRSCREGPRKYIITPLSRSCLLEGTFAPIPVQFINHGSVTANSPPKLGAPQLHPNFSTSICEQSRGIVVSPIHIFFKEPRFASNEYDKRV